MFGESKGNTNESRFPQKIRDFIRQLCFLPISAPIHQSYHMSSRIYTICLKVLFCVTEKHTALPSWPQKVRQFPYTVRCLYVCSGHPGCGRMQNKQVERDACLTNGKRSRKQPADGRFVVLGAHLCKYASFL